MSGLIEAAARLADVLGAENAALEALDLPRAAGMLADKQQAMAALVAAQAAPRIGLQVVVLQPLAKRLGDLAARNKMLLERAIAVQGKVIGIVARSVVSPRGYGAAAGGRGMRPVAFALAARI